MNRYLKIVFTSVLFLSAIISGFAQPSLIIDDESAPANSPVTLDFRASDIDRLSQMHFSVNWDPTKLVFEEIISTNSDFFFNLDINNFDLSDVSNGNLVLIWKDEGPNPIADMIEPGMLIFRATFKTIGNEGDEITINYGNTPEPIVMIRGNGTPGSGFDSGSATFLLPGTITLDKEIPDVNFTLTPENNPGVLCKGDQVCYDLKVSGFDSLFVMQFIIKWSGSVLEFNSFKNFGLESLDETSFSVKGDDESTPEIEPTDSVARASWLPSSIEGLTNGISLPDETLLATLCYDVIKENASTTLEMTGDVTTPEEIVNYLGESLDLVANTQTITTADCTNLISFSTTCQDIQKDETVCIDFNTSNFTDIIEAKYTVLFDPTVLEFVNSDNYNLTNFDASNITVNNGVLTLDWTDANGVTLTNGTSIFSACFKAIGEIDSTSSLQYLDLPGNGYNITSSSQSLEPTFANCDIKILPPTLSITAPMVTTLPNSDICLELLVENFLNIGHIEMPIEWDPTVLEFVEIKPTGLTSLTSDNFQLNNVADGKLELETWDSPSPAGITLPDGAGIFEICFKVIGNLGTESPVRFPESDSNPIFIQNINDQILEINSNDGQVTVETSGLVISNDTKIAQRNTSFCVDIQASNFTNLATAGYSHLYDPTIIKYDSVQISGAIPNLVQSQIVSSEAGNISVRWESDDNTNGTTVADSTTIYSLCFTAIGGLGACADFSVGTIHDITTIESAGESIGVYDDTKDLCIDNFGMTLIDTLRPSCAGGDGQIRLAVSGAENEAFIYFVFKDDNQIVSGADVENDSIILTNLDEGAYSIRINSTTDVTKSEERKFNLNLTEADYPILNLGGDINAGCVEMDMPISISLDGSNFTLPANGGNQYTTQWTAIGMGQLVDSTANQEIATALSAGRYIYTVNMTENNCATSDTIDVLTAQPPRVEVIKGGILGCTNDTLELGIEVVDENPNNTYTWTTDDGNILSGENSFTPVVDQEGWYTFTVLDTTNNCQGIDSTFVIKDTSKPNAEAGPVVEIGCDDGFVALVGVGSVGAQVAWSTTDGSAIENANQEIANVTRVGTYIFTVTNQNTNCQATDTTMVVADESLPVARAESLAIIGCGAEDVKLDASESSDGDIFSYQWKGPNNQDISIEDTIRTAEAGTYLFIVTNEESLNCNADTARVMVTIDKTEPATTISQGLNLGCQAECSPFAAIVPEGDHYTYQWETTDGVLCGGENTPTAMVQSIGVYRLITTNLINNCQSSTAGIVGGDGTEIVADPGPARQIDCLNEIVTLDGRGSDGANDMGITSFSWTTEDGTEISTETTVEVTESGEYTLKILNSETGCTAIGKVAISKNQEAPKAEAGAAPLITGCEFPSGRTLNGSESEVGDDITYAWASTSGIIVGDTNVIEPEIASPGIYVLTVTNTTNGCFSFDEVIVQSDVIIPNANAGSDKQLSCDEPTATLAGISETLSPNSTINWTTLDGNIIGETNQLSANIDAPGTYTLTITSQDGCETSDEVIVNSSIDAPNADAGQALTISCNNSVVINGTGTAGDNIDIEWTTTGGNILSGANTYTPEVNRGGSYTLTVLNTDNNCKTTSLVIVSSTEELPEADAGSNQEICTNEAALSAIQPVGNYTGNWTTLENSLIVNPNEANSMVADLAEGANTYIWTLSNEICGAFSADTAIINVPTFPNAVDDVFEIQPDQNLNTINLIANDQVNSDVFNINILEQPTAGQLNDLGNGIFEFITPARYFGAQQFQYEICSATCSELCAIANVRVVVLPGEGVDTTNTVPNAITPNGDGMNDILLIDELIFDALDYPNSELIIFNRWGDVVYKASPYNNDWQGTTTNGNELPQGTYYYILRLDIVEGEVMKGDITILR